MVYGALTIMVVAFQIGLTLGAPWGAYAMSGAFPGQFPPSLQISALVQAALLLVFAGIVIARSGIGLRWWARASRWLVLFVVVFGAVSLLLNLITPSAGERMIWAPVALILLACSLLVATGATQTGEQPAP